MIIADGLAIRGCTRTGATASPGSQFQFPNYDDEVLDANPGYGLFKKGDLSVLSDCVQNNSATIPSLVIPTGFTSIGGGITGTSADGFGMRAHLSYKIWDGSENSDVITGMTGNGKNRKNLMTFRMSRPIQSVSIAAVSTSIFSTGNPGALTVAASGEVGNILALGWIHSENANSSFSWSNCKGTDYFEGSNSQSADGQAQIGGEAGSGFIRSGYSYYPRGDTPLNSVIDATDFGDFNIVMGCVLALS